MYHRLVGQVIFASWLATSFTTSDKSPAGMHFNLDFKGIDSYDRAQLVKRTLHFKEKTGLTSRQICKLTGINEQHLCDFLAGRKGLSAQSTMRLLQTMNANRNQIEMKLNKPDTATIAHYQQAGQPMTVANGAWVPGLTGEDPVNSTNNTGTNANPARSVPDADELEFLAGLAGLHQQIIDKINARQAQQKAKPNAKGVTEGPRKISDNTISKTPGPRADLFHRNPELLRGTIERMRASRKAEEEKLQLEKELAAEAKAWFAAKQELISLQKR
jgi:hypothetical protein